MGVPPEDSLPKLAFGFLSLCLGRAAACQGPGMGNGHCRSLPGEGTHHKLQSHMTGKAARGEERESKSQRPGDVKTSSVTWLLDGEFEEFSMALEQNRIITAL